MNTGWMRPLCIAYAAKWFSFSDWMLFCRRYGSGFLEGITEATKDSAEWNEALETLRTLENDASVLHNKSVQFKFLEQPGKNQLPFQPMMEQVDRLYAKCYRGVDLATGSRAGSSQGRGSGGQGGNAVGASVQREESGILLVRDAKWVTGVFNDRIDRPIIRYLFNEEPRAWFSLMPPLNDTTMEDLQSLRTLVPMGLRVALKEVYQRFRWSVPSPDEPCLGSPSASAKAMADGQSTVPSPQSESGDPGSAGVSSANSGTEGKAQNEKTVEDEDENENEEEITLPAQTSDSTPIAAGADPARNPGLTPPGTRPSSLGTSRQMPDTQVDEGAFWSRVGLAPRGADGQVLPMPALGYAVPNASTTVETLKDRLNDLKARGLGHCRAAQALQAEINRRASLNNQLPALNQTAIANAGFDSNEPRDWHGQWTTNATGIGTNRPSQTNPTHRVDHAGAVKDTTTKPKTSGAAVGPKPAPTAAPPAEKIALSTNEPALMLERLLLGETLGAEKPGFNQAEALKSIRALGAVIYNRAHAEQLGFTSSHYPTNLVEVLKEKGQFAGFEKYNPKDPDGGLSHGKLHVVDVWMQGANDPKDKRNYANYLAVVKQVKETAQNIIKGTVDDPFSPWFTFAIKTAGPKHTGPGGSFQYLGTAAGNNFYGFPPPRSKNKPVHP